MKVLRIWHAAVVAEYRKKIRALARSPEVDMLLVVPPAWREGGRPVQYVPHPAVDAGFRTVVGRIRGTNNVRRYFFLTGLLHAMATFRPDILDVEEEPFAFVSAQVLLYRAWLRLKSRLILHTAHNIARPMKFPFESLQRRVLRQTDAVIVRNRSAEGVLRARGFGGPVYLGGNGIDLTHFAPGPAAGRRQDLGLGGKKVVGFVGKLKPGKGLLTLLESFRQLPTHAALLLVGDGHLREQLAAIAQRDGFADRLRLVGAVPHEETPAYYRLMDVCVLPSESEGRWQESFGRSLVEAMACGVPVIGSSSGAIPETIGAAGLVFPERNAAQLTQRIREVFENGALADHLRAAGLARATAFTWEAIAGINYRAYEDVLRGAPERR